jgi:beta-lactamase class D
MKFLRLSLLFIYLFSYCAYSQHKLNNSKYKPLKQAEILAPEQFKSYCEDCAVDDSIAIYHLENKKWMVSDRLGIHLESLPASTFKIINLLIALETNTIKSEQDIVKWVGETDTIKYGYRPDIYHDMSVSEAFESSAGWVFVELAKKIGKDKYKEYLSKCHYGNNNLSQEDADFWNFGDFAISPKNQVEFLTALYEEKLPFSSRNMHIVKKVMLSEKAEDYSLFAKTGWTRDKNINTGWWTGYIESKKGTFIFATRLLQDRKNNRADFGNCRKIITKKVFSDLGIID